MKKILFASTALVMAGSMASAQGIELSGSAEMGVAGASGSGQTLNSATNTLQRFDLDRDLQFHTDIDVTFKMTLMTDGGLTFGASIDLDESQGPNAFNASTQGGETIFVNSAFGNVTMGDTDGAFDWAMTEAVIGGSLNDDQEHIGFNGNSGLDGTYDGQIARYDHSFGGFGVAASVEIDDAAGANNDPVIGLGVTYGLSFGTGEVALGLGYQTRTVGGVDRDIFGISAKTEIAGFEVIVNYSDLDNAVITAQDQTANGGGILALRADSHAAIAVGYKMDALSMGFNYGRYDVVGGDIDGYGLTVGYDLGGGAALQLGYGKSKTETANNRFGNLDRDTYSFGVSMGF